MMKKSDGFTLIEILLYMAILGVIISAMAGFTFMVFQSRIKNQTIAEVEQQGNQVMGIILQTVRNSTLINSPAAQSSGNSLSLNNYDSITTPTIFDISVGKLRITEGISSPVNLVDGRLNISNLVFTNVSELNAPGAVRVQFTLTYINSSGTNEYDYNKTFYGTASLR